MHWQKISLQSITPAPWRNGGGSTRELMRWPSYSTESDWLFRLSIAEVESGGPFSTFEGIERWFAVLHGAGVTLKIGASAATNHVLQGGDVICFDGGAAVDCELIGGATQDFNLMLRRNHQNHKVSGFLIQNKAREVRAALSGQFVACYDKAEGVLYSAWTEQSMLITPECDVALWIQISVWSDS